MIKIMTIKTNKIPTQVRPVPKVIILPMDANKELLDPFVSLIFGFFAKATQVESFTH